VYLPRGAVERKRAQKQEESGVAERAGKGKIREGSNIGGGGKEKKRSAYIGAGLRRRRGRRRRRRWGYIHTCTRNEGFSFGVTVIHRTPYQPPLVRAISQKDHKTFCCSVYAKSKINIK